MKIEYDFPAIPWLIPKPEAEGGCEVLSLDGEWHCRYGTDFAELVSTADYADWETVPVPCFMGRRRNKTLHEKCYAYKKRLDIKKEWRDKSLILRFESVNGFTTVYIDGESVAYHENGFLAWQVDLTKWAGREKIEMTITVDETLDKVSSFSQGGIMRSVALYVLPKNHVTQISTNTRLDSQHRHGVLEMAYALSAPEEDSRLVLTLTDPYGIETARCELPMAKAEQRFTLPVEHAIQWDAEHPFLYTLTLDVEKNGGTTERVIHRQGFRQITRAGNRLYVNGREVKLRGACRHEISAHEGRTVSRELIEMDVKLFKAANCNYIRTSHYPPSEYFLQLCDEYGMYVEDEAPLAFIARTLDYTQRDPAQTDRYLSVWAELYARDGSHPSVIMWSLCNESFGGYNFDLLNRFAQHRDPTRPTKFSYPMTVRQEHAPVDIWSIHYSNWNEDLSEKRDNVSVPGELQRDLPVLHDEYVHVPCYNRTEMRRDPNIHSFWGTGIKKYWDSIWNTPGALGGAIWAGIDETDIFRGGETRLEWGIIDIWRRPKPEHYMTRKAYSPLVVKALPCADGQPAILQIENRFCHTNLNEVEIDGRYGDERFLVKGPECLPFEKRAFVLPLTAKAGAVLELQFIAPTGEVVDEYRFIPAEKKEVLPSRPAKAPVLSESDTEIAIDGDGFSFRFSKKEGQLVEAQRDNETVLIGGPIMHMPYFKLGAWKCRKINAKAKGDEVVVTIVGGYKDSADVAFVLTFDGDGGFTTRYTIKKLHRMLPHSEKLRVGVDCGGLDELGVCYIAPSGTDTFHWQRKGDYTVYPQDHISRNEGIAARYSESTPFGQKPTIPWNKEVKRYILNGRYDVDYKGTNDFRSMKPTLLKGEVYNIAGKCAAQVLSDGSHALRLEVAEPFEAIILCTDERVKLSGKWTPREDNRGSLSGVEMWSHEAGAAAEITFEGTGIVWYGPEDTVYGIAKVYVDGELQDARVNQRVQGVDFPGSAPGYDKKYNYPIFSVADLPKGKHTLHIEVTGEKVPDAGDAYIVLDYFRILTGQREEPVKILALNDYNYPHIAWGNYTRPAVMVEEGYTNGIAMKIVKREEKHP